MKTALAYIRVSTDKQTKNYSIPEQKEAIRKYAKDNDMQIVKEFIDSITATTLDRPGLNELRQFIKNNGAEVVIVRDLTRLSRNFDQQRVLKYEFERELGVELHDVKTGHAESPEDEMLFNVMSVFSQYERSKILDRMVAGKRTRALQGKLLGGAASRLYGYQYKDGIRKIDPETRKVVESIFTWFTSELLKVGSIVRQLDGLGIPSPSGKSYWSKAGVTKILKNKAYTGHTSIVFKATGETIDIDKATPAIISEDVLEKAQVLLRRNREFASRNTKREYLLRGYVHCQQCGRKFTGNARPYKNRVTHNYRCGGQYEPIKSRRCSNCLWDAPKLDAIVWDEIQSVLSSPETVMAGVESINSASSEQQQYLESGLSDVSRRLKELDGEQQDLLRNSLMGFPKEIIIQENQKINQHRTELLERRVELKQRFEAARQASAHIDGIKKACQVVSENLIDLSFNNKRLALEALDIKVWIDNGNVRIEGAIPLGASYFEVTRLQLSDLNITQSSYPFHSYLASQR